MKSILYFNLVAVILLTVAPYGCDKSGGGSANSALLEGTSTPEGSHEGNFATITISSTESWRIEVTNLSPQGGQMWITPSLPSGWGNASVALGCTANDGQRRTAQVAVHFESSSETFDISQDIAGSTATFQGNTALRFDEVYSGAFIRISSAEEWEIAVTDAVSSGTADWITVERSSGSGNADVTVNNTVNYGNAERTARITVSFPGFDKTIDITQNAADIPPPIMPGWTELPEFMDGEGVYFIACHTALGGRTVRNYSMCYDARLFGAYWVAYPLHVDYRGDSGRSNSWGYDPDFPAVFQFRYHNLAFGLHNYDRGHQVPSDDRTATEEMNVQTFYSTNITPQRWELNQQKWLQLENWFRDQLSGRDTVWMVTGAHYQEPVVRITNTNNPDKQVAIPAAYYKVAVKQKPSSSEYTAIGFWQDNVDTDRTSPAIPYSDAKTVRWIEDITGINFFANIPAAEQDVFENVVVQGDWNWRK